MVRLAKSMGLRPAWGEERSGTPLLEQEVLMAYHAQCQAPRCATVSVVEMQELTQPKAKRLLRDAHHSL